MSYESLSPFVLFALFVVETKLEPDGAATLRLTVLSDWGGF